MTALAGFQRDFLRNLYDADGGRAGVRVYRNTLLKACVDALQANFPTVARLVGEPWFRAAALVYARTSPPNDPRLYLYGDGFADFLAGFEPAAGLPYLAGVARLDRGWSEAHVAADRSCLAAALVAEQTPDALAARVLSPHPAARWHWFDDQPVFTLWSANREQRAVPEPLHWRGEGALLTRPGAEVRWQALGVAGVFFLNACAEGLPLAAAAERALKHKPGTDLATLLATLLKAGAFAAEPLPHCH
ncbi:HvfC/BufC N-terminal domain-containing protein [Alloalcanivorax mobilis]|uniref:HvfC/BufC N-terminal domain-containing protein n=1 Tax=Alloalcanivorax mobilis TaxID=2019569 RepID=UPI000B5B2298|nr:DNA-binding domain-containing protein [Alloalcanivorax mobilis]ASK34945.1 DUF2063 domain-containing protein [Alcanivorax sp. N3-2A]|tara:strand:- start:4462 stop:5202 length:741 start_codon:yes stop_codon:yes gene_type:complete